MYGFQCPHCRNYGHGRYPFTLHQIRGEMYGICLLCQRAVLFQEGMVYTLPLDANLARMMAEAEQTN
jgi:hypothetical protein